MKCTRKIVIPLSALSFGLTAAAAGAAEMEVEATIQQVNLENRSITVQMGETGQTETFRVPGDVEITLDRDIEGGAAARNGSFGDLQANQDVTLRFDDEDKAGQWVIVRFITVS